VSAPAVEPIFAPAASVAQAFVRARLNAEALADFPGQIPPDLASGYACQEAAIALWPDEIAGWKVGRVPPERQAETGADRMAGPIFRRSIQPVAGAAAEVVEVAFIPGGFAAVEAEFVFRLGADAPAGKLRWTQDDAAQLVGAMHIGMETAGSPLAQINALGPRVIVSDFGNNAGLVLGPAIAGWREIASEDLVCETFIDGRSVGRASAAAIPGGPLASLAFLLEHCARRSRPLRAGQLISTGAATGVHEIEIGQSARIDFGAQGEIRCRTTAAEPHRA
jgi:2-keto-4-pentenoate hydratase